jgi:hypothetical protein
MIMRAFLWAEQQIFGPVAAAPLALVRMLFGFVALFAWSVYAHRLDLIFGVDGLAQHLTTGKVHWTAEALPLITVGLFVGALGMILGLATRFSGTLLAVSQAVLVAHFERFTWGWGTTMPLFVLYVAWGGGGAAFSLDALLRAGRNAGRSLGRWWEKPTGGWANVRGEKEVSGWGFRLLLLNVCCVYMMAGWHRIDDSSWISGDIVYEAVTASIFSRWADMDWHPYRDVLRFGAYAALVIEDLGAILLLFRRIRPWWALLCIALHVGLELSTSVGWWQWFMTSSFLGLLWPSFAERVMCVLWRAGPVPRLPNA